MTRATAPATRRVNRGNGHSYLLDGQKVPGVTTILSAIPKPWLAPWTARTIAEYAADHVDAIQALHPDRQAIIDLLKKAADRDRDAAALKGTQIHQYGERIAQGEEILWAEIAPEQRGHVEQYIQFLHDHDPAVVATELVVAHRAHAWMGTLDLLVELPHETSGVHLVDVKTSRSGPKPEVALQAAAYAHAELVIDPNGAETPLPPVVAGWVLWLATDRYELRPLDISIAMYRRFRYLQMVHDMTDQLDGALGEPVTPIEEPW